MYILWVEDIFKRREFNFSQFLKRLIFFNENKSKNIQQRCIFFRYKTFLGAENTVLVKLHRGIYSSLKNVKKAYTEV